MEFSKINEIAVSQRERDIYIYIYVGSQFGAQAQKV